MFRKKKPKWSNFTLLKKRKEDPHLVANGRRRRRFPFTYSHFPPNKFYSNLSFFKIYLFIYFFFDFNLLLYHGFGRYLHLSSLSLAYKLWLRIRCHKFLTLHCWFDLVEDFFFFLEIMALRMGMSYRPQAVQANEEPTLESFLDLTLT
jgi:hypothetical protein